MQASDHAPSGSRVIILHKLRRQTQRFELVRTKSFGEEASVVLEDFRDNDNHILRAVDSILICIFRLSEDQRGGLTQDLG